jgi:C-terminal processing protease CtpA/Prc
MCILIILGQPADFVDSMDASNYVVVELEKPMGIVFEENDEEYGGIFVQSLKEGGVAAKNGVLQSGDQLVAVGTVKVAGMPFDDALGAIVSSETEMTKLILFRGSAKQLYGPTGASREWLDEFVAGGGVKAS